MERANNPVQMSARRCTGVHRTISDRKHGIHHFDRCDQTRAIRNWLQRGVRGVR